MKILSKFYRLSWIMWLAIFILVSWFIFWIYQGWIEQEYALGLVVGGFPVLIFGVLWMQFHKKKASKSEEYIQLSKYVRVKQKRKNIRLIYPPTKRPSLKLGEHELEIIDISERGLRLLNDKKIHFDQTIHGKALLLSGEAIIVDGEVTWSSNNENGLLINSIPRSIIVEEKRIISKS